MQKRHQSLLSGIFGVVSSTHIYSFWHRFPCFYCAGHPKGHALRLDSYFPVSKRRRSFVFCSSLTSSPKTFLHWKNPQSPRAELHFPNCMSGRGNKYLRDDFLFGGKKGFTLEHRRAGNGFIIHYSDLLLELPVCEYVQQRECWYLAALGVNENAILALICITVRSLQTDWGIMSLSWPQLWFSRPGFGILSYLFWAVFTSPD